MKSVFHSRKLNIADLAVKKPAEESIIPFFFSGSEVVSGDGDIIDHIRDGLPKQAIDNVLEKTGVSKTQLSNILHISTRQLNRYEKDDRLSPEQSNFLYEFTRIYVRALDILGDAETVTKWLMRPNMALGDKQPIDLLDTGEGLRMVDDLLAQIEYGFYS
ncbi:type II RES/Xre toxin-antitoxin system antitoxin [Mucilaginibacter celer]|uniref:DUF2384 domain-containing protein n=1 Tax=Mucilaginibacter celer TaxID=2305508 RepID=A0A494W0E7_9SPHI|nr:antitoxin Xre/MbcA/ParS toxin-binding domain-containing protein [Mucilaginibacter celer]AYL96955.1 DUF2384 domain-containing protein [Mucilaginibacter celer]